MSVQKQETGLSRVAVIVVNYGTAELALQAVESVVSRAHGGRDVTVYLVDNASPGDDARTIAQAHKDRGWSEMVTLCLENENHGFGRGNNVVLEALAAQENPPDAVFLLNPDAALAGEAVDILATTLEANAVGVAGAGVLRPDMTPVTAAFRFPGLTNEVVRIINLAPLTKRLRHRMILLPPDHPAGPVDWVSGAAVIFRFDALRQVGFFDPGFFLYYEEVDLMRRLQAQGVRIFYEPRAQVIHAEGAATGQFSGQAGRQRDPAYLYQSWRHYFTRAFGRRSTLGMALLMWPAAVLNILHRRLRGKPPTLPRHFFFDHWRHVIWPLFSGKGLK